ncbi:MAG: phenylacetic acid degradation operon negative regulatory protein PaaX [Gammaproteobacteria bacterium]|nr:phenylacetic acid degradation operon negative regulatory protein PaaX [Gammaproteobacteria bacterium]MDH3768471.1 phenylacetic acid degradation operon negative regulatory protein PaaX [Gammaproteobacteria bacterium]
MPNTAEKKSASIPTDSFSRAATKLLDDFRVQRPIRAGSLLISVFGDAITPHGGTVWLGALIRVLEGFGINQRLVRTSVFRLVKDGWLETTQIGRRSFYSVTPEGRERFEEASRRIYTEPRPEWPGTWTTVLLSGVAAEHRDTVRKELRWLGFAPFSANLLAHPAPDMSAVESHLARHAVNDKLLIMDARVQGDRDDYLRKLVHDAWKLDELGARYAEFSRRFRPIYRAAQRVSQPDTEQAFQVRTLLIHEYRKVLLRDPLLPEALLPAKWTGVSAYQLCRNLYELITGPTERFLTKNMETAEGLLPPAEPQYFQRFGGLAKP